MSHIKTNYRIRRQDLGTSIIQASHLAYQEALESHWVRIRQSWQHDSATGDLISFSMNGYGRPLFAIVRILGDHRTSLVQINVSVSTTGSVCVASILQTASMGSLAATVTYPYEILGLIASR